MMKTLSSKDWQQYKMIGKVMASPDHQALAYVLSETDYKNDAYKHNIWVYEDNRHFQLTTFDQESNFVWFDEKSILFTSTRKKDKKTDHESEVYCISILGGEAIKLFSLPIKVSSMKVINEDELLILADVDSRFLNIHTASKDERTKMHQQHKEDEIINIIENIPFYENGGSYTTYKRSRLFHFIISKEKLTPITSIDYNVEKVELNQDKTKALLIGQEVCGVATVDNEILEVDFKSFKLKKKTKTKVTVTGAYYVNDDIIGLYKKENSLYGLNENSKIGKLNQKTGQFDLIIDPVYSIGNSVASDIRLLNSSVVDVVDNQLVMVLTVNDHSRLVKLVKDTLLTISDWPGSIDGFAFCNNQWIIAGLYNQQPMELYTVDYHLLSAHNPSSNKRLAITPIPLEYTNQDIKLKGWVMLPSNYNEKKKYPAILNIHGGPKTVYGTVYMHEMQVWAHQGYVVMFTNPRGADGQDNSFSDIRGKYGTIDYDDVMCFVDAVISTYPAIDTTKMGVTGGSYGGFMTNWIIGHSDRFACAITQRSITNWISFYGVSDIGYYFGADQLQASIQQEKDIDKMWWHSPIKYLPNMSTPTLIIHSKLDYRCPIEQAYQLFTGLKEKGVPTKMVVFEKENHDLSRNGKPKARQYRLDEMLEWFNTYLK